MPLRGPFAKRWRHCSASAPGLPAALPERFSPRAAGRADRLRVRADAGYFTTEVAHAAVTNGCDFAVVAKRKTVMWPGPYAWTPGRLGRRDRRRPQGPTPANPR